MAKLSNDQKAFLVSQKISLSMVFDASGLSTKAYKEAMRELGMHFAYGVTPCQKAGHELRTRAGHCMQCDTAKIAYQLRDEKSGYLYLAGVPDSKLLKIGVASDLTARIGTLNRFGYGGYSSWEKLLAVYLAKDLGRTEFQVQSKLLQHYVPRSYRKSGQLVECNELFQCGYLVAKEALTSVVPEIATMQVDREPRLIALFP